MSDVSVNKASADTIVVQGNEFRGDPGIEVEAGEDFVCIVIPPQAGELTEIKEA